ncbi:MAG TPA: GNAT family N-acetyltransferase [Chitinophagaceae bacterium]|nr:GNAT family N-acetyltransferase [Chitinophagaceae bacterium]
MEIKTALTEEDILKCWDALKALRPHLDKDTIVARIMKMMSEGYKLLFIEESGKAMSIAGYRYLNTLFNGLHYYIDDLSTLEEARGKGYGGMLLDHITELASKNGFACVTLNSGYTRHTAHRLYLNNGFVLASHHFEKRLL